MKSRRKGKVGERECAKELNRILGTEARRGRQFSGSPDSPDVVGVDGLHLEIKRDESTVSKKMYRAILQAKSDTNDSIPVVISRRNRENWIVAFELDNIVEFARAIVDLTDE